MAREKKDVVQFRWAVEGRNDPFAHYLDRSRDDLPMADWSDDELANYAFMHYNRSEQQEMDVLLAQVHGTTEHVPKIAFMTAVKERIRWLSRQLAIAQGTYPSGPNLTLDPELTKGPIPGHYADDLIDPETVKPYDVVVVGAGNSRGHLAQLRDYGYLSVEASVFPGVKKARDDSELTDDEKKNPHSYWFKEVNELHTKLGLNSLMVDHRQAESRIRRLAKDVDFHLVQDALGAGAKYIDRLIALRKVRKAVDKAIAESQQKVRDQFGDLGIEDPKPMTTLPSSLIPKDQDK